MRTTVLIASLLVLLPFLALSQPGVLKEGKWMRLAIKEEGLYQIDYSLLSRLAAPSKIDPTTIRLYAFPTGMLPQSNRVERQKGLRELAIKLIGTEDGRFDRNDKIIFYGQGPDKISYVKEKEVFQIENNLYDDHQYYFLTFGETKGKRIASSSTVSGAASAVTTYRDFFYSETDRINILKSGRDWFGIDFDANTIANIAFDMDNIVTGSPVKLITRLMAESYQNAAFKVEFNGTLTGEYPINAIPQTSYGVKGRTRNDTAIFNFSGTSAKHTITFTYDRGGTNYSIGRLDYVIAILKRNLIFNGTPKIFFNTETPSGLNEISIGSEKSAEIWDITDPFAPEEKEVTFQNNALRFTTFGNPTRKFSVFTPNSTLPAPADFKIINNQDLTALPPTEMVIVTHPEFLDQAQRLAEHRLQKDGIRSSVVTTEQVFNEYSGGRMDPTAIRDFVRDRYRTQNGTLRYLLLFGKGTYDYRNLTTKNSTWVPIYQSVNSLSPLETYSSDDYFGFLEDGEGTWKESPAEFHTLDIGVGRIPCSSEEQAEDMVDKIISYDTSPNAGGLWRRQITFVADDGDANIHQSQANQLAGWIEEKRPGLLAHRLYLDYFPQEERSFGQVSPVAADALFRQFHEGSVIINFTGHGSEQLWMAERILDPERIAALNNRFRLPFLVTATCEFGRSDDPSLQSAAEQILLKKASGAIGLVTSSRPVSSATNFDLNSDLYQAFFNSNDNSTPALGTMFMRTKNARDTRIGNRNFILLGDPSMQLAFPKKEVQITSLISTAGNKTVAGREQIQVQGEIKNNGTVMASYQGKATIEVFDRPTSFTTLGDENEPFGYEEWEKVLFRGETEVNNGKFKFTFTTPPNEQNVPSTGKILVHATSENAPDAGGVEIPITLIPFNYPLADNQAPQIQLWMNDTTYVEGNPTGKDPFLVARFNDEYGIDLSQFDNRRLEIILDNNRRFYVEPYYTAKGSKGTFGELRFQFFGLEEGLHQATVIAFDLAGNSASATIEFTVDASNWEVSLVNGFPNPFTSVTSIYLEHTRPGDDLAGTLIISDRTGSQIRKIDFEQALAPGKTVIMEWDGTDAQGNKLPSGLYFLRADVRSTLYGLKRARTGKVVLLN